MFVEQPSLGQLVIISEEVAGDQFPRKSGDAQPFIFPLAVIRTVIPFIQEFDICPEIAQHHAEQGGQQAG